jgi:hypothetical protein
MSKWIVPVKYSGGPGNEVCEPPRATIIVCGSGVADGALSPADTGAGPRHAPPD